MKKKTLSAEALALLAGQAAPAAPEEETLPEVDAETDETVEGTPDQLEQLVAENIDVKSKFEAAAATIAELEAQLAEATASNAKFEADALAVKAAHDAEIANLGKFREIVAEHVSKMRCALSLANVDMKSWTPEALLTEYHSAVEEFEKALPVGSRVPAPKATKEQKSTSSLEAAKLRSLGF